MEIDMSNITSPELLQEEVEKMNSFGVRLTGTKAQRNFIKYLKSRIHDMGIETFSDPSRFMRWEETNKKLVIKDLDDEFEVPISSAFPYSGRTPAEGITAQMTLVREKHVGYLNATDKIAVVEVNELDFLPSEIAFNERERSIPEGLRLPSHYNGPVATAFVNFPFLKMAKLAGAKGVICIWKGINDDCIEGQYLPFILDYQGIPAVWVNSKNGKKVIEEAEKGAFATLTLEGIIDEYAKTESFWCVLDGEEEGESVIINTHTDGTNCIEENGPIAMLAMIKYLKDKPLKRTHIFVFVTGHFRLPNFKNIDGGGVQATSKWLTAHRSHWDGKEGHLKAVAGLSVEHLGCKMWKTDENGEYRPVTLKPKSSTQATRSWTTSISSRLRIVKRSIHSRSEDIIFFTSARDSRSSTAEFQRLLWLPLPTVFVLSAITTRWINSTPSSCMSRRYRSSKWLS